MKFLPIPAVNRAAATRARKILPPSSACARSSLAPFVFFVILGCALSGLLSCTRESPKPKPSRARPLIGYSLDSIVADRWTKDRDIFTATVKELGGEVLIQIADEDRSLQERQITAMAEMPVDSLVVIASDTVYLSKAVAAARRKGIPVLSYERLVRDANSDLYLSFDYRKVGRLQAQDILDRIGTGTVALINGIASDPTSAMIREGWMQVLEPAISAGKVKLAGDFHPEGLRSEEAYAFADGLAREGLQLDAIIAANDFFAEAAIKALSVHRLAGRVAVAGADADLAACQRIAEGSQYMTVYKPIGEIAAKAAELAMYQARSERVSVHKAISDGTYRVPWYILEPVSVRAENLKETVIKDGFQLEEDVYRNVIGRRKK